MKNLFKKLQWFIVCVALFSFVGCDQNKTTISGTFDNCDKRYFVLLQMLPDDLVPIDTVLLLNGTFSYKIKNEQIGVYFMQFSDTTMLPFIADMGEKLVFSGDWNNLSKNYTAIGSEETKLLLENRRKLDTLYLKTEDLSRQFVLYTGYGNYDSVAVKRLDSIYDSNFAAHKQYLTESILSHPDKLASLFAFYQTLGTNSFFSMKEDAEILRKIYSALSEKYPNSIYVKDLHEKLESLNE